ncbi:MAG: universal stress protein [Microthrixaceae bacterium]|nr:universal stress protein [Microthrixaceae bacterium]
MSDTANEFVPGPELKGAVIVGLVPDSPARVMNEAALNARLRGVRIVVVHVDVTRFVTFDDPDGYASSAPADVDMVARARESEFVQALAATQLQDAGVQWTFQQLVGDPALAIKELADKIDASLIVVGTRDRGIGESIREFFTGSVAARLAHRQRRPVLVVPRDHEGKDDAERAAADLSGS